MSGETMALFVSFWFLTMPRSFVCGTEPFQSSPCGLVVVVGGRGWARQPWTECLHKWANLAAFQRAGPAGWQTGWLTDWLSDWLALTTDTNGHWAWLTITHKTEQSPVGLVSKLASGTDANKDFFWYGSVFARVDRKYTSNALMGKSWGKYRYWCAPIIWLEASTDMFLP